MGRIGQLIGRGRHAEEAGRRPGSEAAEGRRGGVGCPIGTGSSIDLVRSASRARRWSATACIAATGIHHCRDDAVAVAFSLFVVVGKCRPRQTVVFLLLLQLLSPSVLQEGDRQSHRLLLCRRIKHLERRVGGVGCRTRSSTGDKRAAGNHHEGPRMIRRRSRCHDLDILCRSVANEYAPLLTGRRWRWYQQRVARTTTAGLLAFGRYRPVRRRKFRRRDRCRESFPLVLRLVLVGSFTVVLERTFTCTSATCTGSSTCTAAAAARTRYCAAAGAEGPDAVVPGSEGTGQLAPEELRGGEAGIPSAMVVDVKGLQAQAGECVVVVVVIVVTSIVRVAERSRRHAMQAI
mmetsp:Transcript_19796/g.56877  ORF Transcript_19796/g.56877 Transcript_19796/m.56877 type:complete len:348 (-) Transcript_19796:109-1152(-)